MNSEGKISAEQLDVYREIATIGAGHAASALANMLGMRIEMRVPSARSVPFNEVTSLLDGPENLIVGTLVAMSDDLKGYILLAQSLSDACGLLSIVLNKTYTPDQLATGRDGLGELEVSALSEIGNIIIGSYLSAIASMTGLSIRASVPELVVDMAGAILSVPAIEYGEVGDSALFLETEFTNKENQSVGGQFFLIPDLHSYGVLMRALGVDV